MGDRGQRHIRKFIGQRLRALRKSKSLSQERLGESSGLSGKFIGEVERGEKSISIDNLYALALALEVPLAQLTDVPGGKRALPSEEAEKIFALMSSPRSPEDVRRAYNILRALFGKVS